MALPKSGCGSKRSASSQPALRAPQFTIYVVDGVIIARLCVRCKTFFGTSPSRPLAARGPPGLRRCSACFPFLQKLSRQFSPGPAHGGPQQDAAQNVGGPVDVEIQPGERRNGGQNQSRTPQGTPGGL